MSAQNSAQNDNCDENELQTEEDFNLLLPKYGWRVKFNHKFREKRNQDIRPRPNQLPQLFGLGCRYLVFYLRVRKQRRKPFIDGINTLGLKQIYGVPMGGIGSGTIGRGFKGEFCRFQMFPGIYQFHIVKTDQFIVCVRKNGTTIYQQVLSPHKTGKKLSAWKWGFDANEAQYLGLYPRSWTTYNLKEVGIKLVCRQVSPVIPHDYQESCTPAAVFNWTVINCSDDNVDVSIMLTFKNGTGSKKDRRGGLWNEPFEYNETTKGVMMHNKQRGIDCTFGIAAKKRDDCTVSVCTSFDPRKSGKELWDDLCEDGQLDVKDEIPSAKTTKGQETAAAVCVKCHVRKDHRKNLEMCLVWDMPKIVFRSNTESTLYRRYSRYFGSDGNACPKLAHHALNSYPEWENKIDAWQNPILNDAMLPSWYKSALFNELYFISDGGSLWIDMPTPNGDEKIIPGDVRQEFGRFAYLEGHEYRMFNTYDVHFYASYALVMLWPKLQLSIQYDIANYAAIADNRTTKYLFNGRVAPRKLVNSVPHDIGDPEEAPWHLINAYIVNDTSNWKDLNMKFVLQVYRDFNFLNDEDYLRNMWPILQALLEKTLTFDQDGDGLIENSAQPDQTYDTWVMKGPSAYCGGLWLASLYAMNKMADKLNQHEDAQKYKDILTKGIASYEQKLWTGSYYKFDCSSGSHSNSIMADQLCGQWYLGACGQQNEVFPKDKVLKALSTVFENNVMRFKNGNMGAVNSMTPAGEIDQYTIQSEEVWTGVTYALAATMIQEGMIKEGFQTAKGMYDAIFNQLGMAYQSPEAINAEKHYRSIGYMRPLSIWSMQWALNKRNNTQ